MNLVAEWVSDLHRTLSGEPLISDVRMGVLYTGVEISSGDVGVAFTPRDLSDTVCCPKSAASAPPAGRLVSSSAWKVAELALSPSALRRAIGIATLNALSAAAINQHGLPEGTLLKNIDALDAARVVPADKVAMVGAFVPFIRKLRGCVADLKVIDKHRDALKPNEQSLWVPPEHAADALKGASVVILSGSTLVEGGIDDLLEFAKAARVTVMAGPTTPMWARPFFASGIDILGGIRVLNADNLLAIISQGGSGYFFQGAAQKVCVAANSARRG
jgi:uncharacterized protein (DUF4213/DUF364 family)